MSQTYTICPSCEKVNRVPVEAPDSRKPVCGSCKTELPVSHGITETGARGLRALSANSPLPVVVDFWAPWCGPCRVFEPTFKQAAQQLAGRAVFVKVNTEADPAAGQAYQIRGIPTLLVLRNGAEQARQSGAMPLPMLLQWLQPLAG